MRPVCSLCNKKMSVFPAARIYIENQYYCDDCYRKNTDKFTVQPIPDEYIGKYTNLLNEKRISASELILRSYNQVSKVHIFLSEADLYSYTTTYHLYGIDIASKKLVYVTYDDDWENTMGVLIKPMGAKWFMKKIITYPPEVSRAFEGFTAETADNYLSVCFPYDLTVFSFLVMQSFDNYAKVAYVSHAGKFYVQVDKAVFDRWREGKNAAECIFSLSDLLPFSVKRCTIDGGIHNSLETKLLYCNIYSTPTEPSQANFFSYSKKEKSIMNLYLQPEKAAEYFAAFEKDFAKFIN